MSKSLNAEVRSMYGMKFGSYNASVDALNKNYKRRPTSLQNGNLEPKWDYVNKDGKVVATVFADAILDRQNGKMYKTLRFDKDGNSTDKFEVMYGHGFYIKDTNNNGVVDENDIVVYHNKPKCNCTEEGHGHDLEPSEFTVGELIGRNF